VPSPLATVPSPLTTLSSSNASCNAVIHKGYLSKAPLGKKTFRNLLVQNPIQGDITISRHILSANLIGHSFNDFEPAVSVNEQLPSSLKSCNTVVEMNLSCPSDTSAALRPFQKCAECTLLPMIHLPLCGGLSPCNGVRLLKKESWTEMQRVGYS
jgi:hypothetical protein